MNFPTIPEQLAEAARRHPSRLTLVCSEGTLSLAELERQSNRCARALHSLGIEPATRTVLMVRPGVDFMILTFGLVKACAVLVLVDPGMGWKHLKKCLGEAEPSAFVGIPLAQAARRLLGWARSTIEITLSVGGGRLTGGDGLSRLLSERDWDDSPLDPPEPESMAALVFTSGSTGPPKGVVYTHRMFSAQVRFLKELFGVEDGEVDLATFPLFGLFDPGMGMTTVFPEMDFTRPAKVDPRKIVAAIQDNQATHMFGSPALLERVGPYAARQGLQFPSLRRVLSAGAPVSRKVVEQFSGLLTGEAQVFTPYGATEALPVCSIGSRELLADEGSARGKGTCIGRPLPGVRLRLIRVTDDAIPRWSDDLEVGDGEVGELVVSGPNVSKEYYGRPEANRLAKIEAPGGEVLHRMGDLGYRDPEGRIWFCGRKSHRVITLQGTLYTVPLEGIFNQHPAVLRTALVGIGEAPEQVPVLCVELEDKGRWKGSQKLGNEILQLGAFSDEARRIRAVLFHHSFPVDVRHNSKIFREKLARWAERRLHGRLAAE